MENKIIAAVQKIEAFEIKDTHTFQELTEMFYEVCREFDIKRGVKNENGVFYNSTEWNIVESVFKNMLNSYILFWTAFGDIPKDLMY